MRFCAYDVHVGVDRLQILLVFKSIASDGSWQKHIAEEVLGEKEGIGREHGSSDVRHLVASGLKVLQTPKIISL